MTPEEIVAACKDGPIGRMACAKCVNDALSAARDEGRHEVRLLVGRLARTVEIEAEPQLAPTYVLNRLQRALWDALDGRTTAPAPTPTDGEAAE